MLGSGRKEKDKTKQYLTMAKKKEAEMDNELKLLVAKSKKKQEFDLLQKMGEACEIAKQMKIPITFTTSKDEAELKIFLIENDEKKQLKNDEFLREYNKLKRMKLSIKNAILDKKEDYKEDTTAKMENHKIDKEQRQKELQEVLIKTMQLTKRLKEQLKILEERGVCKQTKLAGIKF